MNVYPVKVEVLEEEDVKIYRMATLDNNLKPKFIFSANSSIFTLEDLDTLITYWNDIKKQSLELYSNDVKPRNIVKQLFGKETSLKRATKGDLSRENLIRSLIGLKPIFTNKFK